MRILHVVPLVDDQGSYGGAVTVAVNQCIELRRRGHDARIAASWLGEGRPPAELEGVPAHLFRVRPLAPGTGLSALFTPGLLRWVHDHARSFDVAHLHFAPHLVPLAVAAVLRRADVPYVVQAHGALRPAQGVRGRLVDHRLTRDALLSAHHVFTLTPEERDDVAHLSGMATGISLLRHGVVLPERVPAGAGDGPVDVLFMDRLQPNRRVLAFAAAAERLVSDGVDATFTVIGPDGGDLRALRRFIADRPALAGRLRYDGALPHDHAVGRLRRADLYVSASVEDQASPMGLLEAMAGGIPSICTTGCGLAGTLAREQAAIVANPTDDALYGAMRRLLVDRAGRARLSARAAATAAKVFSMAAVAEVLEEEYAGALPAVPPGAARRAVTGHRPGAAPRQRLLWVTAQVTPAHVEVWDALQGGTDLTVALLETPGRPAGVAPWGRPAIGAGELTGRGYAVVPVVAPADRAPTALRALVRDRPGVVVLEGDRPGTFATVSRWARRSGVHVVTATGEEGPGSAAARASMPPGRNRPMDLDLRPSPGTWPVALRGAAPASRGSGRSGSAGHGSTTWPGARHAKRGDGSPDVIDLQQPAASWPHPC